jgi:hypothetical protein
MSTKKFSFLLIAIFNLILANVSNMVKAQQISPYIYGQNAWMPDSIGTKKFYGKFEANWSAVAQSGAKIVRYGGIGVDENNPTKYQYVKMVDQMRANGVEPILQVPFDNGRFSAQNAAAIVQHVNVTKGRNVKYWIIANEPDLGYSHTSASQVAPYIKQFAAAMKAVDPTIKIIGPEVAWYNHNIINGLTTPGGPYDITGKDANGRYYIDYISFHAYPLLAGASSRSAVISNLTAPDKFEANLTELNARLSSCNSYHGRTGTSSLRSAVTEININYQNPSGDGLYGVGASSFIGGQYWAEVLGIAMKKNVAILNFWSTIEGNTEELNIGYLHRGTAQKKPSFYHFQMVAQNFSGTYANGTDNQGNVKSFGSRSSTQISVMIMNQDAAANFNYTVRLDQSAVSGSNPLKININAGVAKEYSGSINNQSTQVLVFDLSGNLIKKIDYGINTHAASNLPPSVQNITASASPSLTATVTAAGGATNICPGGTVVLNANTGTGYTYQWRKNGVDIFGATSSSYTATSAGSYQVKIMQGSASAYSSPLTITATTLTATITAAGSTTIGTGGSVVLNANTGSGYTYQWKKNGTNISGATGASYTATSAGSYVVVVKSGTCSASSAAVNVTAGSLTATITPSGPTTFATGGSVVLKANTGSGYTYQWKKNGSNISGATGSSYTATAAGSYVVVIKSGTLTATSAAVTVTVTALTATITPSGPTTFAAGGSVILKGNTGTGYTYKWKRNGVDIAGATSANYTATTSGSYQLKITLGTTSAYSAPVTVTVNSSAATITPSGTVAICTGGSAKLQANTGSGYTYQWKKNGVNISGATASSYTVTSAGSYSVAVKIGTATTTSAAVSVTVSTPKASITVGGGSTVLPSSGAGIMLYAAAGTGYSYQWRKNGVSIPGATSSSYKVTSAGSYQLKATVGTCSDYSAPVSISGSGTAKNNGDSLMAEYNLPSEMTHESQSRADNEMLGKGKGDKNSRGSGDGEVLVKTGEGKGKVESKAGEGKGEAVVKAGEGKGGNSTGQPADAGEEGEASKTGVAAISENVFNVSIGPNPSAEQFGITVTTSGLEPINVRVYDMHGRLCIEEKNIAPNETTKLGYQLASGHYIAHIEQGKRKEIVKLIKAN